MRHEITFGILITAFLANASPVVAQSVLDRVDPGQTKEREPVEVPEQPEVILPYERLDSVDMESENYLTIGAVNIVGLADLNRAYFTDIIENYIGQTLSPQQLGKLTDALAARARQQYPLAKVMIEPQVMSAGILQVKVDEGSIDEVRLAGTNNAAVLAALRPLTEGSSVTLRNLERRLLLAGDIDGVSIDSSKVVQEDGRNILVVDVSLNTFRGQLTLDNDSTKPLGPLELIGSAQFNNVLASDDTLNLLVFNTFPQISELAYARLRYGKRVTHTGTEISLTGSYALTNPGAYLESLNIAGESWFAGVGALQPLWRSRKSSLWINGEFGLRNLRQKRDDNLIRTDRLTVLRTGISGYTALLGGTLRIGTTFSQGLDLLGATDEQDVLASRDDSNGTFSSLTLSARWRGGIIGRLGANLSVSTQFASGPLLSSEELGLGGGSYARGYDYNERSGDQGTLASGELYYDWKGNFGPLNGLRLYAFADGGKVDNLEGGFGGGTLFSTGGGLIADVNRRTDAMLEVAVPLSGDRYDTDDDNPHIRFSVTRHF